MGKYKKIYVLAPFGYATGGVELAHQLVDSLRNKGEEAYIVYAKGDNSISEDQTITSSYSKYNIKTTSVIYDNPDNIMVLPEIYFEFVLLYKFIQIACWWMSVDNRYVKVSFIEKIRFKKSIMDKLSLIKSYLLGYRSNLVNDDKLLKKESARIFHLYQSHYAQFFLYSKGFSKLLPLSDYINLDLIGNLNSPKKDIVLYNPAKGYEFTKKIISKMPDVEFVALKGLNKDQLRKLLETSKLYIDFGHFPGKDRLPREAVSNGCCIITGRLGASYFYEDVPINDEYKFGVKEKNVPYIIEKIRYVLANYNDCKHDFDFYRSRIRREREIFHNEIEELFLA